VGWGRCDPFTHRLQISIELTIIEGAQLDSDSVQLLSHPSGFAKERHQPVPRHVSIRRWKILLASPTSPDSPVPTSARSCTGLCRMPSSYIARSFAFNSARAPKRVALFQAVARVLGRFPVLPLPHPRVSPPTLGQVSVGFCLHGFDHGLVLEPPLALIAAVMLTDVAIDASVERVSVSFGLLPETLGQPGSTLRSLVGLGCPALDVRQAALYGLPALGDFGVLDRRFRKTVVCIQAKRKEPVF
jgi:hypothetical protein